MANAGPYENVTSTEAAIERAMDASGGVLSLAPAWVPRSFCTPGRRIRLHPDDYFPLGKDRGGIDERWLASAVRAENGPRTDPFEGLSLVRDPDGNVIPFDEFIAHFRADAIGGLWDSHGLWPMYSKFFDNEFPLPFHIHHRDEHAALVGKPGKPEAYYFPPQMNNHGGQFPFTFFGLHPEVTKDQLREKLAGFLLGGDNRITDLSKAYRITPGTGWDVPAGILHAPASMCTYEPQAACDVFAMTESWSNNREVGDELLWKDVPDNRVGDLDFIVELVDWERNVDPEFWSHRFTPPIETVASSRAATPDYVEKWITYRASAFSAKELTVRPGGAVTVEEGDAYGLVAVGGRGSINGQSLAAISSIRYGQFSSDEFFVTASAAAAGTTIVNESATEDLVVLKHFGPANAQLAAERGELGL
ncbi:hypothetical protein QNO21_13470 [Microbacterium sp. zg-Y818]|uniref:hypothetical protein n=1 Tax=unclassified Microbacterium TaxID=2609290 RepID=UPI00214AE9B1|nr:MULTISPECIES: hypothetical protein [unclassified Microbacterium]MCR2800134.1 hypothetical protein [Microbacterium sp. zg.Y818]WIM22105.1 hypothetical protein QNO21_13470 [Microbacterium sp. zg-Y818]